MDKILYKTQSYLWLALGIAAIVGVFSGAVSHIATAIICYFMYKINKSEEEKASKKIEEPIDIDIEL